MPHVLADRAGPRDADRDPRAGAQEALERPDAAEPAATSAARAAAPGAAHATPSPRTAPRTRSRLTRAPPRRERALDPDDRERVDERRRRAARAAARRSARSAPRRAGGRAAAGSSRGRLGRRLRRRGRASARASASGVGSASARAAAARRPRPRTRSSAEFFVVFSFAAFTATTHDPQAATDVGGRRAVASARSRRRSVTHVAAAPGQRCHWYVTVTGGMRRPSPTRSRSASRRPPRRP